MVEQNIVDKSVHFQRKITCELTGQILAYKDCKIVSTPTDPNTEERR